ncbi:epoxyqueuosine reductase [Filimonas sp.]|nr:epoxyqueuosine reductase [Filimonas sp.]
MTKGNYTQLIKDEADKLGFQYCGIAKAEKLEEDAARLEKWLHKGFHGQMAYMENHFEKRIDPRRLVDDAKSVITLLLNYYPAEKQAMDAPLISKYAYGKDYHLVIKEKINALLEVIKEKIGEVHGRGFVDSAPVLERSWAIKSGAGWIGKNGNMITKKQGSFFFIATLIIDLTLEYDLPFLKDYCGTCTQCIDACPTDAILPDKEINGSHCISYYTIELKEALISSEKKWDDWMFGCDICQDVCPWNRFSKPTTENNFNPLNEIMDYTKADWEEITEETFKKVFKDSPLKRTKYAGIKRNLSFLKSS